MTGLLAPLERWLVRAIEYKQRLNLEPQQLE
jgi:hypothetical protein